MVTGTAIRRGAAILICFGLSLAQQIPLQQPGSGTPNASPSLGELPWSDLQVLHTTDTHGWLRGHGGLNTPEPNYSGDWGDLYSFAHHLRAQARERKADLLLVDSGDLHDGNGLTDWDPSVKGHAALRIHSLLDYDLATVGNHELYNYSIALDTFQTIPSLLGDRYLASNVFLTLPTGEEVRFGAPYRRFKTQQGRRILAFGTIFNFTYAAKGVRVQFMNDFVQEAWFLTELQKEEVDAVVLIGHLPVGWPEWKLLHKTIRSHLPDTPVLIFGGHAHVRDCDQIDGNSMTLASGRYLETVGWMAVSLSSQQFSRRYLDNNRRTYQYHTRSQPRFDTAKGLEISQNLTAIAKAWQLSYTFGTAPRNYYLTRHPITHESSVYHLLLQHVFPALVSRTDRPNPQPMMILNSGSVRFDISKGPFTRDSQSLCFPFINRVLFIADVPVWLAKAALRSMLEYGEYHAKLREVYEARGERQFLIQLQEEREHLSSINKWAESYASAQTTINGWPASENRTYGYRTIDRCPGLGDDTQHVPLPVHSPPVFLATEFDEAAPTVDLAWFDFISPMVIDALNRVQEDRAFSVRDVRVYSNVTSDTILEQYARIYWA